MDILPVPGGSHAGSNANAPAVAKEAVVKEKSDFKAEDVKVVAKVDSAEPKITEEERFARFERTAKRFFDDVFVVRDNTFSIFKDNSGQYITRITNLRDGSVTYIPDVEILQYMESRGAEREALVEFNA